MESDLHRFGLSEKEAGFYLFLLENGGLTAAKIARQRKESRTNTYMVLEKLIEQELVVADDSVAVRRYNAADPQAFKKLLLKQQQALKQKQVTLAGVLPQLASVYQLGQHKPGVVYFEGLSGYASFQDDIARSDPPIDVFASNVVPENREAWEALQKAIKKRKTRGTDVRIIFHTDAKDWLDVKAFEKNGYEVRFWGDAPLEGEVAIYGNKVGLTAYQPALITTVITNEIITGTFRAIFEQLWKSAETLS